MNPIRFRVFSEAFGDSFQMGNIYSTFFSTRNCEVASSPSKSLQSMTIESMQQLTTTHSLAVTQTSKSDANSGAVFAGANIRSISGCQFSIFNGPVRVIQRTQKRRRAMTESDDVMKIENFVSLGGRLQHDFCLHPWTFR